MDEFPSRYEQIKTIISDCNKRLDGFDVGDMRSLTDEFKVIQLSMLADIATSLAVIADSLTKEAKKDDGNN